MYGMKFLLRDSCATLLGFKTAMGLPVLLALHSYNKMEIIVRCFSNVSAIYHLDKVNCQLHVYPLATGKYFKAIPRRALNVMLLLEVAAVISYALTSAFSI